MKRIAFIRQSEYRSLNLYNKTRYELCIYQRAKSQIHGEHCVYHSKAGRFTNSDLTAMATCLVMEDSRLAHNFQETGHRSAHG